MADNYHNYLALLVAVGIIVCLFVSWLVVIPLFLICLYLLLYPRSKMGVLNPGNGSLTDCCGVFHVD